MKILISKKPFILIKTLIPGLVGLGMMTIERIITRNMLLQNENLQGQVLKNELYLESEPAGSNWLLSLISQDLVKRIFESYDNYFAFMFMMLAVNVFLHGLDIFRYLFMKRNQSAWKSFPLVQAFLKRGLISLLTYSLIFCFYQIIWIALGSILSGYGLLEVIRSPLSGTGSVQQLEMMLPSRILEQEEMTSLVAVSSTNVRKKKPSLSIGKLLGQVDIYAVSIKVSKDGNTAFVATNFPSTLKIIDISDPEYPVVLSTLNIPRHSDYIFKSILVSADESKLYISNVECLEIIDVRNFKSPVLIGAFDDTDAMRTALKYTVSGFAKPNLLMSGDGTHLFVSGYGLQVFDISVPTSPALICSVRSQISSRNLVPASIALSDDQKTLYYSDGGLWIYNVEDPKNMRVINSFNTTFPITSMIISNDAKTAFVLSQNRQSNILLQKLDISDVYSIKAGKVIKFEQISTCQPVFLDRAPENLFMIVLFMDGSQTSWSQALIFDTEGEHLLNNKRIFVKNPFSVTFTDDYKRVFVGNSGGKLDIVDLFLDYPNSHAFAESKNTLQTFNGTNMNFFTLSKNEDFIYSITDNSLGSTSLFRIHEVSANLNEISSCEVPEKIIQMVISQDNKKAFWVTAEKIIIMDIENSKNITKLAEYTTASEILRERTINFLAVSQDGKTGYLTFLEIADNYFEIVDFSDLENITSKSSVRMGIKAEFSMPVLSHDERTLFIVLNQLVVYNVSDASNPTLVKAIPLVEDQESYLAGTSVLGILSPDGKTLFVRDESSLNHDKIHIIDVSDVASPQIRSDFRFPIVNYDPIYSEKFLLVSADSRTIYIARPDSLMVVDISNLNLPNHIGSIRVLDDSSKDYVRDFSISKDGRKAYVSTKLRKWYIVAIDPVYSTYMGEDILMLGERYNLDLQVLKMNEYMDYERIEADYRFVKFALVEHPSIQNIDFEKTVMKVAPSWMNFDLKTQTLSVEARRKSDIGVYQIYFGFSTQLGKEVFSGMNETIKSEDLVATLLALGYIDSQRFLTEDFGELEDFILPGEYSSVKEKIYGVLKRYSFGTFNELRVVESLNVTYLKNDKLKISTTSGANVKVEISLIGQEAQFLSRHYGSLVPVITGNKSRLILEGSTKDVNLALEGIVVNLAKGGGSCDGEIIVDDKLNPVRTESVKNISRYFNKNMPPRLRENFNLTIQSQVGKESVWTGLYFQIKLNPYTFFDKYTEVENLNYQLVLVKGNNNETTVLPSWLSFSDMTLMGTAPEVILNRDFDFKLVVKNEFQDMKVPFTLHVKISSGFVLKLLMKYSPYILSIVGLLVSANKISNVVFKGSYKHPKDFYVCSGEEITSEVIFPISFIREEIQEARRIMKLLEKRVGARNKSEFLSHFLMNGEKRVSKLEVLEMIKSSLTKLSYEEKKAFSLYLEGKGGEGVKLHPRELINQVIVNTLTNNLLKSNEERETRRRYEEIKKEWPTFIEWDLLNSSFKINDERFDRLTIESGSSILTNDNDSLRNSLIYKTSVNIDLLKDAILAYAFDCQNIDIQPLSAQLQVKERVKANFLKRVLKLDLRDSTFCEKGKIGYGIGYTKEYNTLCFNGIVQPDIMKKTIVIQITNSKQKILKELWVFGNPEGGEEFADVLNEKSEIEAKGKNYEIF